MESIQNAEAGEKGLLGPTEALASRILLVIPAIVAGRSVDEPPSPIYQCFAFLWLLQLARYRTYLHRIRPSMNRSSIVPGQTFPVPALACTFLVKVYHQAKLVKYSRIASGSRTICLHKQNKGESLCRPIV